jgi:hypothetical protein
VLARLKARLDAVCARLGPGDPQRETCRSVLATAPG